MSLSMYQASILLLVRGRDSLSAVLKKGEAHPDGATLVEARLAPDMFTLAGQIQRASDTAKGCAARLAGIDNPSFADTETTFAQLQERIAKTIDFVQGVKPEQIDGSEDKTISIKAGPSVMNFTGASYLATFVIPNFFFHVTTATASCGTRASRSARWIISGRCRCNRRRESVARMSHKRVYARP